MDDDEQLIGMGEGQVFSPTKGPRKFSTIIAKHNDRIIVHYIDCVLENGDTATSLFTIKLSDAHKYLK